MTLFDHLDEDGDKLTVSDHGPNRAYVYAELQRSGQSAGHYVDKGSAPAVALAILEASGHGLHDLNSLVAQAMRSLKRHSQVAALKEQEARLDAERLDAEALELLRAATGEPSLSALPSAPNVADFWRNAARRARQLHNR